jgi:trk system potassium uptake protein TrkH
VNRDGAAGSRRSRVVPVLSRGAGVIAPRRLPVAVRLVAGLALMIVIGTIILSLPGMTVGSQTLIDAAFTTTSAVTVTGLAVVPVSTSFTFLGQVMILLLAQMGGVGFMVMVVLALQLAGRRVSLVDRLALTSSIGLKDARSVRDHDPGPFHLAVEGLGAAFLPPVERQRTVLPGDVALRHFHSVAFCNAGFDSSPTGIPPAPTDPATLGTMGS